MRIQLYRNLHKKGYVYSIRDKSSKLVIGYTSEIILTDVTFHVGQKGRLRVLKENRKNVHAFIEGELGIQVNFRHIGRNVTYNPYLYNTFVQSDNDLPIYRAKRVTIRGKEIKVVGLN